MSDFDRSPDGLAFSKAVQQMQTRLGSRRLYETMQWPVDIPRELAAFLTLQRSVFLASASADGQPYMQHRGGPPGFLHLLDSRTIAMADLRGNRQYITLGNLSENNRVLLFAMDYTNRQRVKIWGQAEVIEDDPALIERLTPPGLRADRALLIHVSAWDQNCPQHIPQRYEADALAEQLARKDARIAALEQEIATLSQQLATREICGDDLWPQ
ncbi:MAG: pyridoxamine 5'-phosphate oxidase family protein [Paracoccus sp. (in: a-proteobacteria)]|uniref:pyridoxamine 5'-phosphate oxidase family protein n=1 Tax=Paracoccus sp. TaxID=267 RepID=UPI0026DFAE5D|nr:pyridoxamine 5'-phosphate oxidase family protein [Paracoccus sp. (in: a-proteobacteria)]MDO5621178.1 pyridoxamine 5'-phosphate oxidase family protein [Paracoccus sp. (in: a-proteobacteria)]